MKIFTKNLSNSLLFFLLIFIFYLLTLKGIPGNLHPNGVGSNSIQTNKPPFETSMERGRYAQVVSLAESGNFDVNEFYKFLKPDLAWYNGKFLSTFPPGVAFLSAPFYILGKFFNLAQVFTFLTSAVFSILTAYLTYLICIKLGFNKQSGLFAAFVYALGSVAWPYSVSFSAHPISAFVVIYGSYLLINNMPNTGNHLKNLFIIGALFGLCFLIDYPNIVIFTPIFLFVLLSDLSGLFKVNLQEQLKVIKAKLPLLLGFLSVFILYVVFNFYYYQKPIAFTNTYSIKFLETSGISLDNITLTNDVFAGRNYSTRFSLKQTISGINTLLISEDRGLLQYSPIYILVIFGYMSVLKKNKKWALAALVSFILNLLVYGSYDDPWGGWAFGPRYLIATLPILAVFSGAAFEKLVKKYGYLAKVPIFALLLFSSSIALLGASTTNGVPPSIEVVNTNIPSNYISNWNYLNKNGISSFVYNILPSGSLEPVHYVLILFILLLLFEFWIIFAKDQSIQIT